VPKPLSLNEIRANATAFVTSWRNAPGDERQEAQTFVRDLLAVYGIEESRAALYEVRARRTSTGRQGYIDALVPSQLVVEMKSAGEDLAKAEQQALDYLLGLDAFERPQLVLTSDFRHFRLFNYVTGELSQWDLAELPLNIERLAFLAGYNLRQAPADQEAASIKAAKLMADLYTALEGSGYDDHEASVFLVRTLFALYADDAGVWQRDLFTEFIETRTAPDGSDLGAQLTQLFQVLGSQRMRGNLDELLARFPYVNGGLFEEPLPIASFTKAMRDRLLVACSFNWSGISPAIFGSLFQAVKSKEARRELGEHYTTETNILKLIGPMFLDQLRARFERVQHDLAGLNSLRTELGRMRFLDPACGCGNFLVIAYREMRALDLAIVERLQALDPKSRQQLLFLAEDLPVKLANFHGIEIEEWPARIATTALHLVEHQANMAMRSALGEGPDTLPLDKVETIVVDNALRLDWAEVIPATEDLYILGNPPFLGHATRDETQAQELRDVWHRKDIGRLDYVTGWYAKTLDVFRRPGYAGEFAFVSTNSITQGEPVPALFGPVFEDGWRIKFAHRTFAWSSEAPGAAAVHCVVLGFDKDTTPPARLFEYADPKAPPVEVPVRQQINGYLVDGPRVLVEQRSTGPLAPDLPVMVFGNTPRDGGALIVEPEDYAEFHADPVAAKYLRRLVGAQELLHNESRWCLWMVDLDPADINRSRLLKERIDRCRRWRLESKAKQANDAATTPHLFWYRSHRDVPHLVVPSVSSEGRRFLATGHFGPEVISSNLNYTTEDPDGLAFAAISSSAFMAWLRNTGGKLESRLRFSNTQVWNTFPLPALTAQQHAAIVASGQMVLEARALHPERSLADHYNPLAMAPELLRAHAQLDRAVDAVFGFTRPPTDDERLTALFDTYMTLVPR